jgi:hypothetical protein
MNTTHEPNIASPTATCRVYFDSELSLWYAVYSPIGQPTYPYSGSNCLPIGSYYDRDAAVQVCDEHIEARADMFDRDDERRYC